MGHDSCFSFSYTFRIVGKEAQDFCCEPTPKIQDPSHRWKPELETWEIRYIWDPGPKTLDLEFKTWIQDSLIGETQGPEQFPLVKVGIKEPPYWQKLSQEFYFS